MAGRDLIDAAEEIYSKYLVTAYQGVAPKFRPFTVQEEMREAETIHFHTMGAGLAKEHPGGTNAVAAGSIRHAKKSATAKNWYEFVPTNVFDQNKTSTPVARVNVAKAVITSLMRREDQECINALVAGTYTSANSIAHGSTGFTYAKYAAVMEFFGARGVMPQDIACCYSEREKRQASLDDDFASRDFRRGSQRVLTEADFLTELGIGGGVMVGSQLYSQEGGLPVGRAAADVRDIFFWDKGRLGLSDNTTRKDGIDWSVERLSNVAWGIQSQAATIIDDVDGDGYSNGVFRVECLTTAGLS